MTRRVVIIDYGSGNLRSVEKAVEAAAGAGFQVEIVREAKALAKASHIILPGVGAFGDCMHGLTALPGMVEALQEKVLSKQHPFLGICVGMQLLAKVGFEHGEHKGLGWIDAVVKPIPRIEPLKIPHMGWNALSVHSGSDALFEGVPDCSDVYFVHSYYMDGVDAKQVAASVTYAVQMPAVIKHNSIVGMQFHPGEKSESGFAITS